MIDVLLIRPPNRYAGFSFLASNPPLNLMYLSASLKENNIKSHILDFEAESYSDDILYSYAEQSKVIGFTTLSNTVTITDELAAKIKERFPKKLIIVGGAHASALPYETANKFKHFDLLAIGESEYSLVELFNFYKKNKFDYNAFFDKIDSLPKGFLAFKDNKYFYNPSERITDLDKLPFPDRNIKYKYRGTIIRGISRNKFVSSTDILTSRGCPFNCYFCAVDLVFRECNHRRIFFRSIENIDKELSLLQAKYDHIWVADSTLNANPSRAMEIADLFGYKKILYSCNLNIKGSNVKLLKKLKNTGCQQISVGVESGNEDIRKKLNKNISNEEIIEFFKISKNLKLRTDATFIVGSHPDERLEHVLDTLNLILKIKPDSVGVMIGIPLPGTPMFDDFKKYKLLPDDIDWKSFTYFGTDKNFGTKYLSSDEIMNLQRKIMFRFYFQFYQILDKLKFLTSFTQLKIYINAILALSGIRKKYEN